MATFVLDTTKQETAKLSHLIAAGVFVLDESSYRIDRNHYPTSDEASKRAAECARILGRAISVYELIDGKLIHWGRVAPDGEVTEGENPMADPGQRGTMPKDAGITTIGETLDALDVLAESLEAKGEFTLAAETDAEWVRAAAEYVEALPSNPYLRALDRIEGLQERGVDVDKHTAMRVNKTAKPAKLAGIYYAAKESGLKAAAKAAKAKFLQLTGVNLPSKRGKDASKPGKKAPAKKKAGKKVGGKKLKWKLYVDANNTFKKGKATLQFQGRQGYPWLKQGSVDTDAFEEFDTIESFAKHVGMNDPTVLHDIDIDVTISKVGKSYLRPRGGDHMQDIEVTLKFPKGIVASVATHKSISQLNALDMAAALR